uniref:Uncharacterized protein n=1 Tax=Faecalibaculum rodentium TaxID=1702221 RepID=A0A140DVD8_9FIRM|nr:hypothetical protein AALO17_14810 [Faecalibaculum rodentium]
MEVSDFQFGHILPLFTTANHSKAVCESQTAATAIHCFPNPGSV